MEQGVGKAEEVACDIVHDGRNKDGGGGGICYHHVVALRSISFAIYRYVILLMLMVLSP
jgi:hypothetical protein